MILSPMPDIILAQQNEEVGIFKLIVPILIAIFWLVTQVLASWSEKKKKSPPSDPDQTPPVPTLPESASPRPAPSPKRVPQAPRQGRPRPPVHRSSRPAGSSVPPPLPPKLSKPKPEVIPPPEPAPEMAKKPQQANEILSSLPLVASEIGSKTTMSSQGPDRLDRLRAILRPANLRKEFILTEILQPPVGLRSDPPC